MISDVWAHEFDGFEHISLVHAKYGNKHLQKELADANSNDNRSKNQSTLNAEDQVSFHVFQPECRYNFAINNSTVEYLAIRPDKLPFVFILPQGPPPKFSC